VRVPDEAGPGSAKVTLSFDAWKEGQVAPSTATVPVVEPRPKEKVAQRDTRPQPKVKESPELRRTLRGHSNPVGAVSFSPDGRTLATADYKGFVKLWDVAGGKERTSFRGRPNGVFSLAFGPDGKSLAYASREYELDAEGKRIKGFRGADVAVRDLASGKDTFKRTFEKAELTRVPFFDGRTLIANAIDPRFRFEEGQLRFLPKQGGSVRRWDLASGRERVLLEREDGAPYVLAVSPDGRTAAVKFEPPRSGKTYARRVQLLDLRTGSLRPLTSSPASYDIMTFTPDGKTLLVSLGRELQFWDVASGKERTDLRKPLSPVWESEEFELMSRIVGVRYSPDGKLLALSLEVMDVPSRRDIAEIVLWDVAAGKTKTVLRGHTGICFALDFSPDGKLLATGGFDNTARLWKVPGR
jgi:WD40 repeat protein